MCCFMMVMIETCFMMGLRLELLHDGFVLWVLWVRWVFWVL